MLSNRIGYTRHLSYMTYRDHVDQITQSFSTVTLGTIHFTGPNVLLETQRMAQASIESDTQHINFHFQLL